VCKARISYAAGYASEFFRTRIVDKEISCAAEGHRHSRFIGKPAAACGANDPNVILRQGQLSDPLSPLARITPAPARNLPAKPDRGTSVLDRVRLAPVIDQLELQAAARLRVLVFGPGGIGLSAHSHGHFGCRCRARNAGA